MYEVFYNFKAEPFRLSPDHRFCFEHKGYAKARAYMAYAFKRAEGFVMITGRPGTGKTTLIGELVESLSRDRVFTANLVCTQLDADDLLKTVAYSFGIGSAKLDKAELLQRLTILFHRWHREGRRALLIVDEAQDLSSSAMEELRLLTNIQIGGQPLLQIFLLGQPELRDLILSPAMEQVHQRIVAATHIDGLEEDETEAYVIHRLAAVGWNGDPAIDRAIFPVIHRFSEGVPRRINLICSRLFLLGSVEQRHAIEVEDVCVVISELQAESLAAGTGFSQDDFVLNGQPEWVPVPVVSSPVRPELHLHTVNTQSFTSAPEDQVERTDEAKKKDISGVASISHSLPTNGAIDPDELKNHLEDEPREDQSSTSSYDSVALDSDPRWLESDGGEEILAPRTERFVESQFSWRRGFALIFIVIVAVSFALALKVYLSHQESRSNPELESQPQAYVGSGQSIASAKPISAPELPASTESIELANVSTSDSSDSASASPAIEVDSTLLPGANPAPENFEQTVLVSFAFDSDDLLPGSLQALDSALKVLRDQPDILASITGFTDSQGEEYYNLALSRKRADAVEQYLVDAGIDRSRLNSEGRGVLSVSAEDQPSGAAIDKEPHRIVQIELSNDLWR